MGNVLVTGFAVAAIITVIEELIRPLGKWRGLLGFASASLICFNLDTRLSYLFVYTLASGFLGLTLSTAVTLVFSGPRSARQERGLPNRVDSL